MGAPRLDKKVEDLILDNLVEFRRLKGYEPSAKQVLIALMHQLTKEGYAETEIPKLRTIQDRLQKARTKEKESQSNSKVDESLVWNLQALNYMELPPESLPHVLDIWRYSLSLDEVLTLRHAKWVSRLWSFFKEMDIAELWLQSRRYTKEEEISLLSGKPMRVHQLDRLLVMKEWELSTSRMIDVFQDVYWHRMEHSYRRYASDGGVQEEFFHAIPAIDLQDIQPDYSDKPFNIDEYNRNTEIDRLVSNLPSSNTVFPDLETRLIYLTHLSHISKGTKWKSLKPSEILDIVVDLRKWVIDTKNNLELKKRERLKVWNDYKNGSLKTSEKVKTRPKSKTIGSYLKEIKNTSPFFITPPNTPLFTSEGAPIPDSIYRRVGYEIP